MTPRTLRALARWLVGSLAVRAGGACVRCVRACVRSVRREAFEMGSRDAQGARSRVASASVVMREAARCQGPDGARARYLVRGASSAAGAFRPRPHPVVNHHGELNGIKKWRLPSRCRSSTPAPSSDQALLSRVPKALLTRAAGPPGGPSDARRGYHTHHAAGHHVSSDQHAGASALFISHAPPAARLSPPLAPWPRLNPPAIGLLALLAPSSVCGAICDP